MNRKEFIKLSLVSTASMALLGCSSSTSAKKSIGLQLYTFRRLFGKDGNPTASPTEIQGTLKSIAQVGFDHLECFDYKNGFFYGIPYKEFNSMVQDLGMRITSGHYKTGQVNPEWNGTMVNDWEKAVQDAKDIGQEYINIAWLAPEERDTIDGYKRVCELMNKANEVCLQAGVKLGYHNHEFEFIELEGQIPYDVMLQELDPSIIMEMDLFWITNAGKDPFYYFNNYPGRFHQCHAKDMNKLDKARQVDIGTGAVDFKAIFEKKEQAGLKYIYLEQEEYPVSELESVKSGYKYLQEILK